MPKFIGRTIDGVPELDTHPDRRQWRKISYSQAKLLNPQDIVCVLDTSDRGGIGRKAKRWYRWYAPLWVLVSHPAATANMRAKTQSADWGAR